MDGQTRTHQQVINRSGSMQDSKVVLFGTKSAECVLCGSQLRGSHKGVDNGSTPAVLLLCQLRLQARLVCTIGTVG